MSNIASSRRARAVAFATAAHAGQLRASGEPFSPS